MNYALMMGIYILIGSHNYDVSSEKVLSIDCENYSLMIIMICLAIHGMSNDFQIHLFEVSVGDVFLCHAKFVKEEVVTLLLKPWSIELRRTLRFIEH